MKLYCFLILHYNALEDTENCIESIKKLDLQDHIRIVIVDNHSPNGTGSILLQHYQDDPAVKVIITEENYGFSRGNNIGCDYAVKTWDPDFLIVANNDITFPQNDFLSRIEETYSSSDFDILGPDIYDPFLCKSQNPMDMNPPSAAAAVKTICFNSIVLLMPGLFRPLLKAYFESPDSGMRYDSKLSCENVVLQGSCLIYSKKYLKQKLSGCGNMLFYPETRFYYEEYIQTVWARRNMCRILYCPDLLVNHMGGRSTAASYQSATDKYLFRMENIRNSAIIYLQYLCSTL